jgi:hypothetical protein
MVIKMQCGVGKANDYNIEDASCDDDLIVGNYQNSKKL